MHYVQAVRVGHGFRVENTGGNCTSLTLDLADGTSIGVTAEDDCLAPEDDAERVWVGLYDDIGEPIVEAELLEAQFLLSYVAQAILAANSAARKKFIAALRGEPA